MKLNLFLLLLVNFRLIGCSQAEPALDIGDIVVCLGRHLREGVLLQVESPLLTCYRQIAGLVAVTEFWSMLVKLKKKTGQDNCMKSYKYKHN